MSVQSAVPRRKVEWACEALTEMANQLGPMVKLPTVKQLAAELGISTGTLHRVLLVLEKRDIVVRRHGRGIYTSGRIGQRRITLLLSVDPFQWSCSPMERQGLAEMTELARAAGCELGLHVDPAAGGGTSDARRHLQEDIAAGRVHGILAPSISRPAQVEWLRNQQAPVVYGEGVADPESWQVRLDYQELLRLATAAVIQRGCTRIALFDLANQRQLAWEGNVGLELFQSALASAGLAYHPEWYALIADPLDNDSPLAPRTEELGSQKAMQLWSRAPTASPEALPDAVIFTDDVVAFGALTALGRLGVRVGTDLVVVTQASKKSPVLMPWPDQLLRVEFDLSEFNCAMVHTLITLMSERRPTQRVQWIQPRLREPGSGTESVWNRSRPGPGV